MFCSNGSSSTADITWKEIRPKLFSNLRQVMIFEKHDCLNCPSIESQSAQAQKIEFSCSKRIQIKHDLFLLRLRYPVVTIS